MAKSPPSTKAVEATRQQSSEVRLTIILDRKRHTKLKLHAIKAGRPIADLIREYVDRLDD
jgi:hypothetical protein